MRVTACAQGEQKGAGWYKRGCSVKGTSRCLLGHVVVRAHSLEVHPNHTYKAQAPPNISPLLAGRRLRFCLCYGFLDTYRATISPLLLKGVMEEQLCTDHLLDPVSSLTPTTEEKQRNSRRWGGWEGNEMRQRGGGPTTEEKRRNVQAGHPQAQLLQNVLPLR